MTSPTSSTSFTSPRTTAGRPARGRRGGRRLVSALLAGCAFLLAAAVLVVALGVGAGRWESPAPQGELGTSSAPSQGPSQGSFGGIVEVIEHTMQGAAHGLSVLVSGHAWSSSVASSSSSSSASTWNGSGGPVRHGTDGSRCPSGEQLATLYRRVGLDPGHDQAHAVGHVTCAGGFAVVGMVSRRDGDVVNTIFQVGPPLRLLGSGPGPVCSDDPGEHGTVLVAHEFAGTLGCATTSESVPSGPAAPGSPSGHEPGTDETAPSSGPTAGEDDVDHQADDPAGNSTQTPAGTSDQPTEGTQGDPALEQGTEGAVG